MRVVLDTNVVVSAFLSPAGTSSIILRMVLNGNLDICINTAMLTEYEQVLCRPVFVDRINKEKVQSFFDIIYRIGIVCESVPDNTYIPDEDDRKFYDLARASGGVLITGNKKHYPQEAFIFNPASFVTIYVNNL